MRDSECWDTSIVGSHAVCDMGCGDKGNKGNDSQDKQSEHVDLQVLILVSQVRSSKGGELYVVVGSCEVDERGCENKIYSSYRQNGKFV
jgi:hypothetical protein